MPPTDLTHAESTLLASLRHFNTDQVPVAQLRAHALRTADVSKDQADRALTSLVSKGLATKPRRGLYSLPEPPSRNNARSLAATEAHRRRRSEAEEAIRANIQRQVDEGSLVIRQMSPAERRKWGPPVPRKRLVV